MHENSPAAIDLLVTGGVVITVDADRRIFRDGAVAIEAGQIVEVGRSAVLAARFNARRRIDAGGGAVTPGFIDAHTHVSQHLGRGSIPDTWPEEREHEQWRPYWTHMTPEDDDASTTLACLEMVRNGTTAFSDLGGHFEVERKATIVERIGLRGALTEIGWDRAPHPDVATGDTDQTLRRLERAVDALPFQGPSRRAWGGVGIPGMGTASDELLVGAKALADAHGLVFFTHASFGDADADAYRRHAGGLTATEHFERLGILDDKFQLIHMIRTTAHEVPILARSGTHVVHCPAASLRVGMGVSRVGVFPEMVGAGVNVALGSDSGNYSDFYDVGRQMYLAATIHREARGVMPTITAEQAIEMATINGARAIGAGSWLGSLEAGKQADLVVHRWDRPEWRPGVHPVNSLVYSAQSGGVDTVIVGGDVILEGGRFTRIDEAAELARVDAAARALNQRSGYRVAGRWPVIEWGRPPGRPSALARTSFPWNRPSADGRIPAMSLVIDGLRKRFGSITALDGLSFEVPRGQVFGFLGANGAGKTTTMRILLGVLNADAGRVTLGGREHSTLPRQTWGYLPEERGLYPRMTVLDQLTFFGGLYGLPRDVARRRALDWLARFRVPEFASRRADELSKGNQQKVQFLAAILHDPDVLLLDEPFTGLDPVNVALLREAFLELRDLGKTIIFSTHQMETVETLCESLAIVDRGRVVVGGSLREVKRSLGRQIVKLSVVGDHRLGFLTGVPGARVIRWGVGRSEIELDQGVDPGAVLRAAMASGADVRHFEIADPSLEQIFIDNVGRPPDDGTLETARTDAEEEAA